MLRCLSTQTTTTNRTPMRMASTSSIYLSGLYPIRFSPFDLRHYLFRREPKTILNRIQKNLEIPNDIRIKNLFPRYIDGGAIIEIENLIIKDDRDEKTFKKKEFELLDLLLKKFDRVEHFIPWWMGGVKCKAYIVKGKPWLEDLDHFPNRIIHIGFEQGPELSQEDLYNLIRPFGRIKSIEILNSKESTNKIAKITLDKTRTATIIRNCLHGYKFNSTILRISYAPRIKSNIFKNWITSHPRIFLPFLVLFLGGISYTFFNPIRTFFIKSKLSGTFDFHQYQLVNWIEKETLNKLSFLTSIDKDENSDNDLGASIVEKERIDALEQLSGWISGLPETFVVVSGPKGSGKSALVEETIQARKNVMRVDCEKICKGGINERSRVTVLAKEIGYFPYFGFLGTINHLIDIGSVGLIGQKAGFESSIESEIRQTLDLAEIALANVAERISKKERLSITADHLSEKEQSLNVVGADGGYGEIPVVVLKGFYTKKASKDDYLWDELADWASRLIEKKIAHVIFISENVGIGKPLSKALSSRAMNLIHLTDASPDSALQYIARQMSRPEDRMMILNPNNACLISKLGGRLTELEKLIEKIQAGIALEVAVEEIVVRSMMEIKKKCVKDGESGEGGKWTREQVWELVRALDEKDELKWHSTVVDMFNGDESVLYALEDTDLITIVHRDIGGSVIRIGKPVYRSAIRRLLTEDITFTAYQDRLLYLKKLKKVEDEINQKIEELIELAKLFPFIDSIGSNSSWSLGLTNGKLPVEIRWKIKKVLQRLKVLESEVDRWEGAVEEAKRKLKG
ncbi:hypothetical protein CROQUDRAFT_64258 [Cronartium quercuum f. sp. fusiforme G11]|uniref:Mitochondrial escape protein 2 n=1 Tax=Cronartium quercuum f. sp. fusiforme G11 TaxID=708437 RepID=A0A9P6NJF9_9BASI|nr:hypothetical protein CROQUDRAFT_64258 [Cronartium quercuum f. sp. fusiforme G11]